MSKYIIDLRPDCKVVQQICASDENVNVGAKSVELFDALTDEYVKENFKDLLEGEYQRGLSEGNDIGYKNGVKDGQNEAWEAAKKIALMDTETSEKVTGYFGLFRIMENLTPMQAIEKLKAYEEKQSDKIKRGDIVNVKGCCNDGLLGVVTNVLEDNCYIMWDDGSGGAWCKDSVVKTGKHIDIDKILEELRYDS